MEPWDGKHLRTAIEFKNSGQTPAKKFRWVAMMEVVLPPSRNGDMIRPADGSEIPTHILGIGATIEADVTSKEVVSVEAIEGGPRKICVAAIAYYDDVFDESHKTRFCAVFEPTPIEHPTLGKGVKFEIHLSTYHNDSD